MGTASDTYDDGLYFDEIKAASGITKDESIFLAAIALVFAEHKEWNTMLLLDAGRTLWDSFSGNEKKPEDTPAQRILRNNINKRDDAIFTMKNVRELIQHEYIYVCENSQNYYRSPIRGVISRKGALQLKNSNPSLYELIKGEGAILRPLSYGAINNDIWDKIHVENKKAKEDKDKEEDMEFEEFSEDFDDEDWDEDESFEPEEAEDPVYNMTPKQIAKELDKYVYSQEEAKKDAALLVWTKIHNLRRNFLFIGPSGCGKTEIFRALKKLYKYIWIYDASSITSEGWKGAKKYYSVFDEMKKAGFSREEIEKSIVVFDEFDKLVTPTFDGKGKDVHAEIQGEFLAMVEGNVIKADSVTVDTSRVSFAFLGAFEELTMKKNTRRGIGFGDVEEVAEASISSDITAKPIDEITIDDLIKYGMKPEIAGRISNITRLRGFDKEDYKEILKNDRAGIISRIADEYGMNKLTLSDEETDSLASEAEKTGLGIRYLNMKIRKLVDQRIFEEGAIPESL